MHLSFLSSGCVLEESNSKMRKVEENVKTFLVKEACVSHLYKRRQTEGWKNCQAKKSIYIFMRFVELTVKVVRVVNISND
jgi:hypothetical protein